MVGFCPASSQIVTVDCGVYVFENVSIGLKALGNDVLRLKGSLWRMARCAIRGLRWTFRFLPL